jgi:hypothetical protein
MQAAKRIILPALHGVGGVPPIPASHTSSRPREPQPDVHGTSLRRVYCSRDDLAPSTAADEGMQRVIMAQPGAASRTGGGEQQLNATSSAGCGSGHRQDAATEGSRGRLRDVVGMILSGGIAGCVMWTIVLPVDTAKTRIQAAAVGSAQDMGLGLMLRTMWAQGGAHRLWAGLGPTLLRAFPANAAQWLVWEATMGFVQG